jgi:hypothetical protein
MTTAFFSASISPKNKQPLALAEREVCASGLGFGKQRPGIYILAR